METCRFAMAFILAGAAWSFAANHDQHGHHAVDAAAKAVDHPTPTQKTCLVSGDPVQGDVFIEHDGQKVYFCCSDCIPKFKAAPMKYLPALYRQLYPQTVQLRCPVMGGAVDGKTFTEHRGQRIGFCCPACISKFKAEPAKYLSKLEKLSTVQVHCPVTGKAIDPTVSLEHRGKTIYFNGEDALAKFKSDPGKYAPALRTEAGLVARGPTGDDDLILVIESTGKASIHKRKHLKAAEHKDMIFYLHGDDGVRNFQADPGKYAKALAAEMKQLGIPQGAPGSGSGQGGSIHDEKRNPGDMNKGDEKQGGQSGAHAYHKHGCCFPRTGG